MCLPQASRMRRRRGQPSPAVTRFPTSCPTACRCLQVEGVIVLAVRSAPLRWRSMSPVAQSCRQLGSELCRSSGSLDCSSGMEGDSRSLRGPSFRRKVLIHDVRVIRACASVRSQRPGPCAPPSSVLAACCNQAATRLRGGIGEGFREGQGHVQWWRGGGPGKWSVVPKTMKEAASSAPSLP